jgi:hypothetical protein
MKRMNSKHLGRLTALFLAAGLILPLAPHGATEIFKARMLTGKAPVEPALVNVQIEVESWTTPEEIRQLQDVLSQSGIDPFLAAFSAMKKGVVRFMYARGWNMPIHMAQVLPTEKGKTVMLFLNRQGWDPGSFQKVGRHYFMAIELKLNAKGKGEGRFYEDAQMRLDSMLGKIELETYESAPKILPQVQEIVKKKQGS